MKTHTLAEFKNMTGDPNRCLCGLVVLSLLLLGTPSMADSFECGDVDQSGMVGAADALRVLRRATGLPETLQCPCLACTTSTTQGPIGDECFYDEDCGDPERPFCMDFECHACSSNEHCPEGKFCGYDESDDVWLCVPFK